MIVESLQTVRGKLHLGTKDFLGAVHIQVYSRTESETNDLP